MRLLFAAFLMLWPVGAFAQDRAQTLADIRAELVALAGEITSLRGEMMQTGQSSGLILGENVLVRMDTIEAELARITARAEAIELRLSRVVADGTNRIGDLEFRLCEVTEGCNVANLGEVSVLGGSSDAQGISSQTANVIGGAPPASLLTGEGLSASGVGVDVTSLAIAERADFERAIRALATRDYNLALTVLSGFSQTYPGSPLTQEAHLRRGQALFGLGQVSDAARAFLDAFSGSPDGAYAPESLMRLGDALANIGQYEDACVTLSEVELRYPDSPFVVESANLMRNYGCQ